MSQCNQSPEAAREIDKIRTGKNPSAQPSGVVLPVETSCARITECVFLVIKVNSRGSETSIDIVRRPLFREDARNEMGIGKSRGSISRISRIQTTNHC